MFTNQRYATKGVRTEIPIKFQVIIWDMLEELKRHCGDSTKDFQIFILSEQGKNQKIFVMQECLDEYFNSVLFSFETPINDGVIIFDNGECTTMIMRDEYFDENHKPRY